MHMQHTVQRSFVFIQTNNFYKRSYRIISFTIIYTSIFFHVFNEFLKGRGQLDSPQIDIWQFSGYTLPFLSCEWSNCIYCVNISIQTGSMNKVQIALFQHNVVFTNCTDGFSHNNYTIFPFLLETFQKLWKRPSDVLTKFHINIL